MKTSFIKAAIAAFTLNLVSADLANAQDRACRSPDPVNTMNEMFAAIFACWEPPVDTAGMSMTVTFSLRRNGTLIGKPRANHSKLGPDDNLNRVFITTVFDALDKALPLLFSDGMGHAIAGRILAPRFAVPSENKT